MNASGSPKVVVFDIFLVITFSTCAKKEKEKEKRKKKTLQLMLAWISIGFVQGVTTFPPFPLPSFG
jgi:hypothetical protein